MTEFSQLGLSAPTLQAVADTGYTTATPIQEQAIPVALAGRDVLGIAQTGTGKTAAFTLPMIDRLASGRARARMPRALVLAPTRELADQVAASFEKYAKGQKLSWALLIGGVSMGDQVAALDKGVDVLIATPGRLLDLFDRSKILLTGVQLMVVDEADRMLDMGFIPDIERIFKLTPPKRQTLFFSATMPPEITRLTQQFLKDPTRIEVARPATTADTITQYLAKIPTSDPKAKRTALRSLIDRSEIKNGIVFCNRKSEVDIVAKSLRTHGYDAGAIHGDLDQATRMRTLENFRKGELKLLCASDVAARGLDIPDVSHVFNYDVPHHADDYVHRIGRTGRAGRTGEAFMIVTPGDDKNLDKVLKLIGKTPKEATFEGIDWSTVKTEARHKEANKRDRERARGDKGRGRGRPASETSVVSMEAIAAPTPTSETPAEKPARRKRPAKTEPVETVVAAPVKAAKPPRAEEAPIPLPSERPDRQRREAARPEPRERDRDRDRGRRDDRRRDDRGEDRDDRRVVGFGADMPAFMMRATPLATTTPED
ncbi:DEAD/DEAH box helicase [Caulobacter mirabilis]|uniref:DEAD-box ATP-dependent RNA helicase RhpA n=1 Tax=Caulobacter mirabilis TaxID=69666 RepID=A0A2D2AZ08_9CAUL|nr:DEAD/DEAH box helicase [Caulobacter mirabilis]ATQ43157.1 RNA helicase [Caulobacter mirabilis]